MPQDPLVPLGEAREGLTHERHPFLVRSDDREMVLVRFGELLQVVGLGGHDPEVSAPLVDGDGAHGGEEVGAEVLVGPRPSRISPNTRAAASATMSSGAERPR